MSNFASNRSLPRGLAAAVLVAGLLVVAPLEASAQYYHRRGPGAGAVAAGVVGGLALGALAAGAARPYYGPQPYYGPGPAYVMENELPPPPRRLRCWFEREDVWDGYGYAPRRIRVCR
jgi:hypothetical protein